jgi:hypothetical protein
MFEIVVAINVFVETIEGACVRFNTSCTLKFTVVPVEFLVPNNKSFTLGD